MIELCPEETHFVKGYGTKIVITIVSPDLKVAVIRNFTQVSLQIEAGEHVVGSMQQF